MNLFNPLALAHDLRDERLTEVQKSRLLMAGIVIQSLYAAWRAAAGAGGSGGWYLFQAAAGAVGIYFCHRANAAGDNRRFVERYVCLSVPLTMWVMVIGLALGFTLYGLGVRGADYLRVRSLATVPLWLGYFAILWRLIGIASRSSPGESQFS